MSYEKQNFEDGQVLSAAHLNHIEDGVSDIDGVVTELEVKANDVEAQVSALVGNKISITNLFNKDSEDNVDGYLLDVTPSAIAGYSYSHLIPVELGKTYYVTEDSQVTPFYVALFYNKSGAYVMRTTKDAVVTENGYRIFVVPTEYPTIVSMRIAYSTAKEASFLVAQTDSTPAGYVDYGKTLTTYKPKKEWNDKKWVCVGDSLTEVNVRTDIHYFDYIAEKTGITVVNMGVSGTGYKSRDGETDNGDSFYQRVQNVPTDADVITIFGSGNDLYTNCPLGAVTDTGTDTLCGCINTTLDNLFTLIPTARVGLVTPTPWNEFNPADTTNAMELYSNAIVEICRRRSIPCLDLYHCSGLRPWEATFRDVAYTKDPEGVGCHPDETGHAIIAPRFKAFLNSLLI